MKARREHYEAAWVDYQEAIASGVAGEHTAVCVAVDAALALVEEEESGEAFVARVREKLEEP